MSAGGASSSPRRTPIKERVSPSRNDPVSPELALVDQSLAQAARSELAAPGFVGRRLPDRETPALLREPETDRWRLKGAILALVAVAAAVGGSTVAGDPPTHALVEPGASGSVVTTGSTPVGAAARTVRMAWAPARGAASYRIEVVRGGSTILAVRSDTHTVTIPRRWQHAGARLRLQPEDRVYVWAVSGGGRPRSVISGALVFDLTLPSRFGS
jgi:hypothetical protein